MSEATAPAVSNPPAPLVALTEDEVLFRDTVRQFADESIRPHVKEMDEKGVFEHSLIDQFFELGLMGIEVPEEYGGGAGTFFEAILAVEELSRVDPSAGVVVDVQNTLVNKRSEEALPAAHVQGYGGRLRAQRSRFGLGCLRAADARGTKG